MSVEICGGLGVRYVSRMGVVEGIRDDEEEEELVWWEKVKAEEGKRGSKRRERRRKVRSRPMS